MGVCGRVIKPQTMLSLKPIQSHRGAYTLGAAWSAPLGISLHSSTIHL